jgi:hypothetical protein
MMYLPECEAVAEGEVVVTLGVPPAVAKDEIIDEEPIFA